jgi:hypothetical protein
VNNSSLTRSLARTVYSHYQTASNGPKEKERETIIAVRSHSLAPTFFLYTRGFYHLCTPLFTRSLSLARSRLTLTRSPESSLDTPPVTLVSDFSTVSFHFQIWFLSHFKSVWIPRKNIEKPQKAEFILFYLSDLNLWIQCFVFLVVAAFICLHFLINRTGWIGDNTLF